MKNLLLIIDMQNDFCSQNGSLYVPGAEQDVKNLCCFIHANKTQLNQILLSKDIHSKEHIAHASIWKNAKGECPQPFTQITYQDVLEKKWIPSKKHQLILYYLKQLEQNGEFTHTIWPNHCLKNSFGSQIVQELKSVISIWETHTQKAHYVEKGEYPYAEFFGIFQSNVIIPEDKEKCINKEALQAIESADSIFIAGEAKTHCVAYTIKQLFDLDVANKDLFLLEDCMSSIPGFQAQSTPIYQQAITKGLKLINKDYII